MRRARRLQRLWSWLPAFRAVAETEHLPSAAELLYVTPPALSRAIRLLEDDLGRPLFERQGRRIRLNSAGREFLATVRDAMRRLDDGVQRVTEQQYSGPLHIAGPMPFLSLLVLPALDEVCATHTGVIPHLSSADGERANAMLLDGRLDLVFLDNPVPNQQLRIERVTDIEYGVYCGPGHPLWQVGDSTMEEVARHPFAAPPDDIDHWPAGFPRQVTLVLSHLLLGIEACATGRYLAVLPDLIVRHHPVGATLHRLPLEPFADAALWAVRRTPLDDGAAEDVVLAAVRERVSELEDDHAVELPARESARQPTPV